MSLSTWPVAGNSSQETSLRLSSAKGQGCRVRSPCVGLRLRFKSKKLACFVTKKMATTNKRDRHDEQDVRASALIWEQHFCAGTAGITRKRNALREDTTMDNFMENLDFENPDIKALAERYTEQEDEMLKLRKENDNKEKIFQKHAAEVGETRKQIAELERKLQETQAQASRQGESEDDRDPLEGLDDDFAYNDPRVVYGLASKAAADYQKKFSARDRERILSETKEIAQRIVSDSLSGLIGGMTAQGTLINELGYSQEEAAAITEQANRAGIAVDQAVSFLSSFRPTSGQKQTVVFDNGKQGGKTPPPSGEHVSNPAFRQLQADIDRLKFNDKHNPDANRIFEKENPVRYEAAMRTWMDGGST